MWKLGSDSRAGRYWTTLIDMLVEWQQVLVGFGFADFSLYIYIYICICRHYSKDKVLTTATGMTQ